MKNKGVGLREQLNTEDIIYPDYKKVYEEFAKQLAEEKKKEDIKSQSKIKYFE